MEIIKIIDGSAGRTVTVTGLTQTTITQDNILGIINEGNGKTLYSPINRGNITGVTYSDGTLTITLKDTVTAIAAGDKVLVKLYFDDVASGGGDATEQNQETIIEAIGDNQSGASTPTTVFGWIMKVWNYLSTTITNKLGSPDTGHTIAGDASAAATAADSAAGDAQTIKGRMGQASDTAAEGTDKSLFAWVKSIAGKFATFKEAIMGGGSGVGKSNLEVYNHIPSVPTDYAKEGTTIKNLDTLKSEVVTALQGSDASAATLVAIKNLLENSTNGLAMLAKEATLNTNTAAIEGKIGDTFVKVDFTEDGLPLTREGGMCPITDGTDVFDGDYDMQSTHETSYAVGTIIQCTADNEFDGSSDVYAFIKAGASNLGISSGNVVTGTFEFGTWKKGHYYRVAQIIEATDLNNETTVHIFTYEELPATVVEGFDQTKEAVQAAKQAIKGSDAAATLTAIYAHLNGGGSLPADVQQQLTLILNYLGSPAAMSCEGMTPQEVVDELEDIFGIMGLDIAPCSVGSDGKVTAPSES